MRLALSKNTCHTAALFPQHGFSQVDLWGQKQERRRDGGEIPATALVSDPPGLYVSQKNATLCKRPLGRITKSKTNS